MDSASSPPVGLHVVYGSRTRRGLNHANEDRHAVAVWKEWRVDAHLQNTDKTEQDAEDVPKPHVTVPLCTGSARKDTTVSGSGATGRVQDPFASRWEGLSLSRESSLTKSTTVLKDDEQPAYLWTVCDGHDGPEAANFVCRKIGDSFSRIWHSPTSSSLAPNLLQMKKGGGPNEEGEVYARGYALSNALARTFEALDAAFKVVVSEGGQLESCTAGSCVTSIFLSGNLMCCAGLGDCKAAILTLEEADVATATTAKPGDASTTAEESAAKPASKATQQFQVTWFSKEHRSSSPKERARIRARGGWFRHGRIGGVLEPTRTIGDFDVKASQPPGVVIATPEVRTFSVTKPALVLVASDGVWDVMDASQLLRTLKKRRRLWRGILSWLGAPLPERRSLMTFGFRRRAKSKEGLEAMLQMPTGGDLCAMADTLVTRAHDLGSDDDCTCMVIYLRPAAASSRGADKREQEATDLGEPDQDINASSQTISPDGVEEDDDDDEDLEEEELEEDDDVDKDQTTGNSYSPSADSFSEYEKWRNPAVMNEAEENAHEDDEETHDQQARDDNAWDLSTATFPVALVSTAQGMDTLFPSSSVDAQDAPEVIEKARRRREERRAARERRKRSLEEKQLLGLTTIRLQAQQDLIRPDGLTPPNTDATSEQS